MMPKYVFIASDFMKGCSEIKNAKIKIIKFTKTVEKLKRLYKDQFVKRHQRIAIIRQKYDK